MNARLLQDEGIDLARGSENVARILHAQQGTATLAGGVRTTETPAQPAPAPPARRKRSDAGMKRPAKSPPDPEFVAVELSIEHARYVALLLGQAGSVDLSRTIQDTVIAQLQRRIDALKGK